MRQSILSMPNQDEFYFNESFVDTDIANLEVYAKTLTTSVNEATFQEIRGVQRYIARLLLEIDKRQTVQEQDGREPVGYHNQFIRLKKLGRNLSYKIQNFENETCSVE